MLLEALLLIHDPDAQRVLRKALEAYGIQVQIAADIPEALAHIATHKYDGILVDCDDLADGIDVLRNLRAGKANRSAIAFAITNGSTSVKSAYEAGANLVFEKPLTIDRVQRTMRAAFSLMVRERRRYMRHEVEGSGTILTEHKREVSIRLVDVSEGGICATADVLGLTGGVQFRIDLPGCSSPVEGRGKILWSDAAGQIGILIESMAGHSKPVMQSWFSERLEELDRRSAIAMGSKR